MAKNIADKLKRCYKAKDIDVKIRFYLTPKWLIHSKKYKNVGLGEKMAYSILRDRLELSKQNDWVDENGYVYLYFNQENLGELLNVTRKTTSQYLKKLEAAELIVIVRQGQGKPNRIYITDIEIEDEYTCEEKPKTAIPVENTLMGNFYPSRRVEITHQDGKKLPTNDTKVIDTEFIDTQSVVKKDSPTDNIDNKFNKIIEKAEINLYKGQARELLENTIKKLLQLKELKIKSTVIKRQQIHQQLLKLDINTCDYALAKFRQVQKEQTIKNKSNYFMVLLYSAIDEVAANSIY